MAQYVIINNIDNYDDVCIICHGELKSNYLQCTSCNKICHQKLTSKIEKITLELF